MAKRNYKLQDVYDYLKQEYNLEWRLFQIKARNVDYSDYERGVRAWNFGGKDGTELCVIAIVYQNNKRKTVRLRVTNDELEIYEINPYLHYYKAPKVEWKDFLSSRYNQGKLL